MRTNVDLDDELIEEAFRYANVRTKKDLLHLALREFVASRRRHDVRELRGTVDIVEGYDYKSSRTRDGS